MADTHQTPAKPGTACLGCRRRKLKCSREPEGCSNCLKTDLPCVYPAPEPGVKRKRGPYKKDKAPRERHLEDLVKYLEPKANGAASSAGSSGSYDAHNIDALVEEPTTSHRTLNGVNSSIETGRKASNSEDLVKDALIALTKSHVCDRTTTQDNGTSLYQTNFLPQLAAGDFSVHPTARRVFEYWRIFFLRVDPMLKIIHCPSFAETLLSTIDNFEAVRPAIRALVFSIYHAAVSSCTSSETQKRFGEDRGMLLQRYGRIIETTLADNYSMPDLESLQALVLYILIGLEKDPGKTFAPLEAELRRRLWWHICGLESRGAEEGGTRQTSIIDGTDIGLPSNLNDIDLSPDLKEHPQPREGITEATFPLIRCELVRLVHQIYTVRRKYSADTSGGDSETMKVEQREVLEAGRQSLHSKFLRHLHPSRPIDWLCIAWLEGMLIKARLIVDYPFGQIPTRDMSPRERFDILQASVDILHGTQAVEHYKDGEQWSWYFRGWVQWHSIAIVIAELGNNQNQHFVDNAWKVLDPILAAWDKVYQAKRDEPAWEHVNMLIERARRNRQQMPSKLSTPPSNATTQPLAPVPYTAFPGIWQTGWGSFDGGVAAIPPLPHVESTNFSNPQNVPTLSCADLTYMTGPSPTISGLDINFGNFDGFEDIDWTAFEGVFGNTAWDYSSPSTDLTMGNVLT